MRNIFRLFGALIFAVTLGCASIPRGSLTEPPLPDAIVDVYFDGDFWGSLGIVEGVETRIDFDEHVTILGDRVGLGIQMVARDFSFAPPCATGELKVVRQWIDPEEQESDRPLSHYPVISSREATVRELRFDSSFDIVLSEDGRLFAAYGTKSDSGWRFLLRKVNTEPDESGQGEHPGAEDISR